MRVSCIQLNAGRNLQKNLSRINALIRQAARKKPFLVALPETCVWRGDSEELHFIAELTPRILEDFCVTAKKFKVALLIGSLMEQSPRKGKFFNTSYLINPLGEVIGQYRKIHLFDIKLGGRLKVTESSHTLAGNKVVVSRLGKFHLGLTICYDLRFPELYRNLAARGAEIGFVPANFTYETGKAHWECLLRARAIENQMFIVAPAQVGVNPGNKIKSFGSSMIIDPWGRVLAEGSGSKEEIISAVLDLKSQALLRRQFPVLSHRKPFLEAKVLPGRQL